MDELDLSGKKYISAKRAAELTGYAKDYVGQLARSGKIAATRFGRAWYVEEASILAHARSESAENAPSGAVSGPVEASQGLQKQVLKTPIPLPQHFYKPYAFPNTWSSVKYLEDNSALIPELSKANLYSSEITSKNIVSSEKVDIVTEKNVPILKKVQETHTPSAEIPFRIIPGVNFDIPQPGKPAPVRSLHVPVKTSKGHGLTALAMAGAAGLLIASYAVVAASFSANSAEIARTGAYTASALSAFEALLQGIAASPYVQAGISAVVAFVNVITGSFWAYAQAGIDFIKGLI